MPPKTSIAAVAVVFALASCGRGASEPEPAIPTAFASAGELVKALDANGLSCGTVHKDTTPATPPVTSRVECGRSIITVYADSASAQAEFDELAKVLAPFGTPLSMAIGSNWTVNGDDEYVRSVSSKFEVAYRTNANR
ncbi:hypothetical protein [Phytohabitans aurantiacus]|uniref:Lipoprotein n=1 Tax=Phytohabitans aurantiacus TaxID=3016789 RepID=A0ABQ5QR77_9ACTN|nr:hypothetical protein [Phytohabitans aurantiacus]GLH97093.1 hypothetical protein Pa4123_23670 [Phytohabitans aurantiacus]